MYIVLPIVFIALITLVGAIGLRRCFVEVLPVSLMSVMIILYFFYCVDLLVYGWFFWVLCEVIAGIFLVRYIFLGKDNCGKIKDLLIRPEVAIWLGTLLLIAFVTRNNQVILWDELRLWGAYPKILFYTENLQLGDFSMLFEGMDSYFPGMPLLAYFFLKCGGGFRESQIFFAYGIFAASILVSCLCNIKRNQFWTVPIGIIAVYLVPTLCYNSAFDFANYYFSLFVDPVIGLVLGYMLYLIAFGGVYTDTFYYWRFVTAMLTMIILKESGISFALICFVASLILEFIRRQEIKWIKIGCGILACLCTWSLWRNLCAHYNAKNPVNFSLSAIMDLTFLKEFAKTFVSMPVIRSNYLPEAQTSFLLVFAFLTIVTIGTILMIPKFKRKGYWYALAVFLVAAFVFVAGIYIVYTEGFDKNIRSFPRYICTILSALLVYVWCIFMGSIHELNLRKSGNLFYVVMAAIGFAIIFPYHSPNEYERGRVLVSDADQHASILQERLETIGEIEDGRSNIFLICEGFGGEYVLIHHRIYFDMLGTGYNINNFSTYTILGVEGRNAEEIQEAQTKLMEYLHNENCQYVFIAGTSAVFNEQFGNMFDDSVAIDTLWKVQQDASGKNFVLIGDDF